MRSLDRSRAAFHRRVGAARPLEGNGERSAKHARFAGEVDGGLLKNRRIEGEAFVDLVRHVSNERLKGPVTHRRLVDEEQVVNPVGFLADCIFR